MSARIELIRALKKERGWITRVNGDNLELIRTMAGRPVTITLIPSGSGKYHLQFPSYIFQSTISHFAPAEDEHRYCRNKVLLAAAVKVLKRSALWNYLDNRDFMVINDHNPRSNKRKLREELDALTRAKRVFP